MNVVLNTYQKRDNTLVLLGQDTKPSVIDREKSNFISAPNYKLMSQESHIILQFLDPTIKSRIPIARYHLYIINEDNRYLWVSANKPTITLPTKAYTIEVIAEDMLGNMSETLTINIK